METFTSKIGAARQIPGSRVWIEGARLVRAGFVVGARYALSETDGVLVLTLTPEGKRRVSGKGDKPIIDITGDLIRRVFARRPSVLVDYSVGTIRIS
jgi:hypothetical protein